MKTRLRPCPWCGCKMKVYKKNCYRWGNEWYWMVLPAGGRYRHSVKCPIYVVNSITNFSLISHHEKKKDAVESWNMDYKKSV